MDRPSSSEMHGALPRSGGVPDTEEAEATRDLVRMGMRFVLFVGGFFTVSMLSCATCILWGPDRVGPAEMARRPVPQSIRTEISALSEAPSEHLVVVTPASDQSSSQRTDALTRPPEPTHARAAP